jgi:hypothetical protein
MMQITRNLTDSEETFLRGIRFLIMDRDAKYTEGFRDLLAREGLEVIRLPPRSPNLNAFAERFVRTIKEQCVDRMIFFCRSSLERALSQYTAHYHSERNHQGVGNRLLRSPTAFARRCGPVRCRERLGGMRDAQLLPPRGCLIEGKLSGAEDSGQEPFPDSTASSVTIPRFLPTRSPEEPVLIGAMQSWRHLLGLTMSCCRDSVSFPSSGAG